MKEQFIISKNMAEVSSMYHKKDYSSLTIQEKKSPRDNKQIMEGQKRSERKCYKQLESPTKPEFSVMISKTTIPKHVMISCRECKSENQPHLMIRTCFCCEELEYIHKECLYETLSKQPNHTNLNEYFTVYGCKTCEEPYSVRVRSQFTITQAWVKRQNQVKFCIIAISSLIVGMIMMSILLSQKVISFTTYYFSFIILAVPLLVIILFSFNTCLFTQWQFVDKFSILKNAKVMHRISKDWIYEIKSFI